MSYITSVRGPSAGCVFCNALSGSDDRTSLLLTRRPRAFLILNRYPYASGHLMAVVNRHVGTLLETSSEEMTAAMELVALGVSILSAEYRPEGFNIGLNQGRVAGAGIVDHLHMHVVPRWNGDNAFIAVVGDTRVLPETLETTYDRLKGRLGG